jgi:hypothetical protein
MRWLTDVVLGKGARFFAEGQPQQKLELTDTKTYARGVVGRRFRPSRA